MKGPAPKVTKKVAQLIKDCGFVDAVYKSDREASIRALLAEAAALAGVKAEEVEEEHPEQEEHEEPGRDAPSKAIPAPKQTAEAPAAVPETSSPGESQSNGSAERGVQMIEDMVRTLKAALEDRIGCSVPCASPIVNWMFQHAGLRLTKYHVGPDQLTGYMRLH